jgi:LacI family transcriptional regulator
LAKNSALRETTVPNPSASPRRKRTARFVEIAELAGVSPSTVDRVLNERGSVSAAARERVVAAARELALPRLLPETRHGLVHVDVLLPESDAPFFRRLDQALQRAMQMLDRRVIVHRLALPPADDTAITAAIAQPRYRRAALIVTTHDTARVRDALASAIERDETVVTMVTDIADVARLHYTGARDAPLAITSGGSRPGPDACCCSADAWTTARTSIASAAAARRSARRSLISHASARPSRRSTTTTAVIAR